ncbi:hypothetical protein ACUY3H_04470 [Corynebacterium ureicelerivorans]
MSIDYDRLRELLEQWQHGDEVRDQLEAQWEMELAAPNMARELLRQRDGSSQLLAKKRAAVKRLYSTDQVTAAVLEGMCDELENLLIGDTE